MSALFFRHIDAVEESSKAAGSEIRAVLVRLEAEVMAVLRPYCEANDIGWVMGNGLYFFTALEGGREVGTMRQDLSWTEGSDPRGPVPRTGFKGRELVHLLNEGLESPYRPRGWDGSVEVYVDDEYGDWEVTVNAGPEGAAIVNLLRSDRLGGELRHRELAWWTHDVRVGE